MEFALTIADGRCASGAVAEVFALTIAESPGVQRARPEHGSKAA